MKYIISKIFILTLLFISCAPKESKELTFVYDYENIFTEQQKNKLIKLLKEHEKKTTNEIVIVTTSDWGDQENIVFFTQDFFEREGVGKKGKNNGVVITFSKNKRETRIGTGYGTEKVLKDEITKKIIDNIMIPQFKNYNLFDGIYLGASEVIKFLERPENKIK